VRYVLTTPPDRVSYASLAPSDAELEKIRDLGVETGILTKTLPIRELVDRQFIPAQIAPDPARYAQ
jgi:hypothetical protein